jgi:hypothetical protein
LTRLRVERYPAAEIDPIRAVRAGEDDSCGAEERPVDKQQPQEQSGNRQEHRRHADRRQRLADVLVLRSEQPVASLSAVVDTTECPLRDQYASRPPRYPSAPLDLLVYVPDLPSKVGGADIGI